MMPEKTIILGVGNSFRTDDGAGLLVASILKDQVEPGIEVKQIESGSCIEMIEHWQQAKLVVIIDAMQAEVPPGTVQRWDISSGKLPAELSLRSTHLFGVTEAIALARVLDRLPQRLIIYGIEGVSFAFGADVTPLIERQLLKLVESVKADCLSYCSP